MIEPIPKPAPLGSGATVVIGALREDALPVFIHEATLESVLDHADSDPSCELGGFLLGGLHVDRRDYVEIRHFLPAQATRSRAASLTFTHETWARLQRDAARLCPGDLVVGWQHTHPNFGIFLSAYDTFVHRHFFAAAWQVALVVDPCRHEFGFFQWSGEDIVDCGFYCVRAHAGGDLPASGRTCGAQVEEQQGPGWIR